MVVTDSLAGRNLTAEAAAKLGLIDTLLPVDGFLDASLNFVADTVSGQVRRTLDPAAVHDQLALQKIRKSLDDRFHKAVPAPYRALDLLEASGLTLHASNPTRQGAALPAQQEQVRIFGELLLSDQARSSRYALTLTQSAAKSLTNNASTAQPRPVSSVGVIGAGLMASQLALLFARQLRVPVLLTDLAQDRIDSALEWIRSQTDKLTARGALDPAEAKEIQALITGTIDKSAFADRDIVIEAVFEDLAVKREVFAQAEAVLRPDAILLTNTSSLSISDIAAGLSNPERLVGFHFFNPVDILPLVELIPTPDTDQETIATALELAKKLQKTAVFVKDKPGFVVNRLLTRLITETLSFIDDGADPYTVDHALDPLGLPMTPLRLLQFIGPAVQQHIGDTLHAAYPERFGTSSSLRSIVAAGLAGYLMDDGQIAAAAAAFLPESTRITADEVRTKVLNALAQETEHMLAESVVEGPEQIDLCMILGANFPFHTGGLTPLLDRETGTAFRIDPHLTSKETV
jgi:3-hydroxyacyl-CoA dehydrogenase